MNPTYFGDSYDLVKRFFCREISLLGYIVAVDPMLTGAWSANEQEFYRLICAKPIPSELPIGMRAALFIDPDTGINATGSRQHVSFDRLVREAANYDLVFAFDQSFSRQRKPEIVMREKLSALRSRGCHGMYYDSHARFAFLAQDGHVLHELQLHLLSLGLPASRIFASVA